MRTAFANTVRNPLANLVGYETHSVNAGDFCPLAIQLEAINNSTGEIAIKDLLTVDDPRGRASIHAWADQIHVWNGGAWTKYFYNTEGKWVLSTDTTKEADETVRAGQSVFFLRSTRAAGVVTLAGGVHLATTPISTSVSAGDFTFVSYPWPMQFAIKDFKSCISDIRGRTSLHAWADQIQRWNGGGWTKYYYNSTLEGFVKDGEDKVTEEKLNVGEGVFFLRSTRAGATLTFTKPEGL